MNEQPEIHDEPLQRDDGHRMRIGLRKFGPVEVTILERLDWGMRRPDTGLTVNDRIALQPEKYTGNSQVIEVVGWLDIQEFILTKKFEIMAKVAVAVSLIFSDQVTKKKWLLPSILLCTFSAIYSLYNLHLFYWRHRGLQDELRGQHMTEGLMGAAYFSFFLGVSIYFIQPTAYILLGTLPFLGIGIAFCYYRNTGEGHLSHRAFALLEAIQLLGICLKLVEVSQLKWEYILWLYTMYSIYISVLGLICFVLWIAYYFRLNRAQVSDYKRTSPITSERSVLAGNILSRFRFWLPELTQRNGPGVHSS
jgi:hypothetical protein